MEDFLDESSPPLEKEYGDAEMLQIMINSLFSEFQISPSKRIELGKLLKDLLDLKIRRSLKEVKNEVSKDIMDRVTKAGIKV